MWGANGPDLIFAKSAIHAGGPGTRPAKRRELIHIPFHTPIPSSFLPWATEIDRAKITPSPHEYCMYKLASHAFRSAKLIIHVFFVRFVPCSATKALQAQPNLSPNRTQPSSPRRLPPSASAKRAQSKAPQKRLKNANKTLKYHSKATNPRHLNAHASTAPYSRASPSIPDRTLQLFREKIDEPVTPPTNQPQPASHLHESNRINTKTNKKSRRNEKPQSQNTTKPTTVLA